MTFQEALERLAAGDTIRLPNRAGGSSRPGSAWANRPIYPMTGRSTQTRVRSHPIALVGLNCDSGLLRDESGHETDHKTNDARTE